MRHQLFSNEPPASNYPFGSAMSVLYAYFSFFAGLHYTNQLSDCFKAKDQGRELKHKTTKIKNNDEDSSTDPAEGEEGDDGARDTDGVVRGKTTLPMQ